MPQVKDGPKGLNDLLEKVYKSCMENKDNTETCSRIAWDAAKDKYKKDKDGKWVEKSKAPEDAIELTDDDYPVFIQFLRRYIYEKHMEEKQKLIDDLQGMGLKGEEMEIKFNLERYISYYDKLPDKAKEVARAAYDNGIANGLEEQDAGYAASEALRNKGWELEWPIDGEEPKWVKVKRSNIEDTSGEESVEEKVEDVQHSSGTKAIKINFISDAFFIQETTPEYVKIKGIAVTPGIHNSFSGRLAITQECIKQSLGKWEGLPIVDVHDSESLQGIRGHITKDFLGPGGSLGYEAVIYKTMINEHIIAVMERFKKFGVSIGAAGEIDDKEDDEGYYGELIADQFEPVHLGIMQDGAQADKSAYGIKFKASKEAIAALKLTKTNEGNSMTEEELKEKIVAAEPEDEEKDKEEVEAEEEETKKEEEDKSEEKMQEADKEEEDDEEEELAGGSEVEALKEAIVESEKEKSDLAAKVAELMKFKEGIEAERKEAERKKLLVRCKELAELVDEKIEIEDSSDFDALVKTKSQLRDKIVERAVAAKLSGKRKAVRILKTTSAGTEEKGTKKPYSVRFFSRDEE